MDYFQEALAELVEVDLTDADRRRENRVARGLASAVSVGAVNEGGIALESEVTDYYANRFIED